MTSDADCRRSTNRPPVIDAPWLKTRLPWPWTIAELVVVICPVAVMLTVDDDGKGARVGLNATNALFTGIYRAAAPDAKDARFGAQIKGLGDQAVRLPKLGLNVLQGDTVIGIISGPVPDSDAKSVAIARVVLKRL